MTEKKELEQERIGLALAMGLLSAIVMVGSADGDMDDAESVAAVPLLHPLSLYSSETKSKVIFNAAWAMVNRPDVVKNVWNHFAPPRTTKALLNAHQELKKLPLSDRYRYDLVVRGVCTVVGEASGGGFFKGSAFSQTEQDTMMEVIRILWAGESTKPLDKKYDSFAEAAQKFVTKHGF